MSKMEVTDSEPKKIAISFRSLLDTITEQLQLSSAAFQVVSDYSSVKLSVSNDYGQILHEYNSEVTGTFEEAHETVSRVAVKDMSEKYYIYIEDVSSMLHQEIERCIELYNLKCTELERLDKGWKRIPLTENAMTEVCGYDEIVAVDFLPILSSVIRQFKIPCSPLETIQHKPLKFRSWICVGPNNSPSVPHPIFGDSRASLAGAKQNLARKVLLYLIPLYSFEIIDANYNPRILKQRSARCNRARENYLALKESVLGLKERSFNTYQLIEQDCVTPTGAAFRIPSLTEPPIPPKKRRPIIQDGLSSDNAQIPTKTNWDWKNPPQMKLKSFLSD